MTTWPWNHEEDRLRRLRDKANISLESVKLTLEKKELQRMMDNLGRKVELVLGAKESITREVENKTHGRLVGGASKDV